MEATREIAEKIIKTVDAGLCHGVGKPIPGQMCVEAAVCYAFGLPHGDSPPCVGSAVRAYKIKLNDSGWSSNEARAKGMRAVSIAQLGSDQVDQNEFRKLVVIGGIQKIMPLTLRALVKFFPAHKDALELVAETCSLALTFVDAKSAAWEAKKVTGKIRAYASADAYAAAAAAADAAEAAYASASASADAYAYADAAAAEAAAAYASASAAAAAYAAAAEAAYASADAYAAAAADAARDSILSIAAQIAVDALIELKSKGTEWLDLLQ